MSGTLSNSLTTPIESQQDSDAAVHAVVHAAKGTKAFLLNPRLGIAFWFFAAGLSLACVTPMWLCHYFPSQNGPSLLHIAYMEHEFTNPHYGFFEFYDLHSFPAPYRLQTTVLQFLFLFLEPLLAQKVWITAILLLRCGATFSVSQSG